MVRIAKKQEKKGNKKALKSSNFKALKGMEHTGVEPVASTMRM